MNIGEPVREFDVVPQVVPVNPEQDPVEPNPRREREPVPEMEPAVEPSRGEPAPPEPDAPFGPEPDPAIYDPTEPRWEEVEETEVPL